jgi:hypothetical protein
MLTTLAISNYRSALELVLRQWQVQSVSGPAAAGGHGPG